MRVAVAGGTGVVGQHVVSLAVQRGHEVVVLARSQEVDLTTMGDLAHRLEGVDAVVDVSGTRTQQRRAAWAFFTAVTGTLLGAEERAGVGHHLALSIVGIDRVDTGYYAAKVAQEHAVVHGPVPWSILRATQFHEFAEQALDFVSVGPLSLVPHMRVQPVAAAEVADALVGVVEAGPSGRVPDLAGPAPHDLIDLTRHIIAQRGHPRRAVGVPLPGRAMRSGALLPGADAALGRVSFDTWLGHRERD